MGFFVPSASSSAVAIGANMNGMPRTLERLTNGHDLTEQEATDVLLALTASGGSQALSGAVLAALVSKGETAEEIRGFAEAVRHRAMRADVADGLPAIDIVGTGGDGSNSLNLSTGAALLTASCGQPVVKHGNRSVSSRSGSADVLEALGLTLPHDERSAVECLERTGFTFLFAPYFHPAMKAMVPVRRALGIRTVFNILGPLTNPAEPPYYLIGAYDVDVAARMAEALAGMKIERAFVVHGACGWDEATPFGPLQLFDVRPGSVRRFERDPAEHGVPRCQPSDLIGGDPFENARRLRAALEGEQGPHRDALELGAALALEVTGAAETLGTGLEIAAAAIDDGSAARLLERLRTFSPTEAAVHV